VVDVITGFKSELAALPPGFIPMTEDMGRAALIAAEGPEQAQQTLAKATAVVNVVRSISPDVADAPLVEARETTPAIGRGLAGIPK